jgi:membrane fusion protein, copper/silver efflux system
MNLKKMIVIFLMILVIALVSILIYRQLFPSSVTAAQSEKKPLYWVDPMEPTIHYPKSGKSRMGMELMPVYTENPSEKDQSSIRISPAVINNLGIRTAPVIYGTLPQRIETVGYVSADENKISHIHPYAEGWVKNLVVKTAGEPVKKGQLLLQLYSPQLVNAQEEYLITLSSHDPDLISASIQKLQALRIPESQIAQLKKTGKASQLIDMNSPQNGVVAELKIREGMRVTPDTEIMSLVDLSTVWILGQIFENQASSVTVGESAEARFSAFPGQVWKGTIDYIYPQVDPTTRTLKIRFHFDNPDGQLKPNMYANITLLTAPKQSVLLIPTEALIRTSQGTRVIILLGNGQFQSRDIQTGMESDQQVEVLSGLKAGETVVTSGQFLIDSESNLKAGMERLEKPPESKPTPAHSH